MRFPAPPASASDTDRAAIEGLVQQILDIKEYQATGTLVPDRFAPEDMLDTSTVPFDPEGTITRLEAEIDARVDFLYFHQHEAPTYDDWLAKREAEKGTMVEEVRKLIAAGESGTVEFKQSLEYVDPATLVNTPENQRPNVLAEKQKGVLHSALKTICAFLNSKGGTLLLGVHDNGTVIGIEPDFTLCGKRQDRDGFENKLTDLLKARFRPIPTDLDIRFVEMDGKTVCRIDAPGDPMPHYLDNKLYVRLGNSTEELTGRDLQDWLNKRTAVSGQNQ